MIQLKLLIKLIATSAVEFTQQIVVVAAVVILVAADVAAAKNMEEVVEEAAEEVAGVAEVAEECLTSTALISPTTLALLPTKNGLRSVQEGGRSHVTQQRIMINGRGHGRNAERGGQVCDIAAVKTVTEQEHVNETTGDSI